MADTPGRIAGIPLLTAYRTIFTVPTGKIRVLSELLLVNTDSVQRTVKLNHVTAGNPTPDVSNAFMWLTPMKSRQVVGMGRGWIFEAGDSLQALADSGYVVVATCYYADRDA